MEPRPKRGSWPRLLLNRQFENVQTLPKHKRKRIFPRDYRQFMSFQFKPLTFIQTSRTLQQRQLQPSHVCRTGNKPSTDTTSMLKALFNRGAPPSSGKCNSYKKHTLKLLPKWFNRDVVTLRGIKMPATRLTSNWSQTTGHAGCKSLPTADNEVERRLGKVKLLREYVPLLTASNETTIISYVKKRT